MKLIILAGIVAVIVEALVDYGQTIYDLYENGDRKKALKQVVAIALALVFSFQLKVTIVAFLTGLTVNPVFDMIVSGVFMSRGANYLFDLFKLIRRTSQYDFEIEELDEDEEDEDFDEDQEALMMDDLQLVEEGDE